MSKLARKEYYPGRKVKAYLRRDSDTKVNVILSNDKFKLKELLTVELTHEMILGEVDD